MIKHDPKPAKVEEKCPKCDMTFKFKSLLDRHIPTSHRDYVKGNSRANQYKKMKKLNVPKAHQFETCTEKDLITMIEKADVSQNQLLKILAVFRRRFGRKAFEPNLAKKMREHLNSMDECNLKISLVVTLVTLILFFLQCAFIVSPQCTKISKCITALVTLGWSFSSVSTMCILKSLK